MPFDLIIQNTASKEVFLISGITDSSDTYMAYLFKNFTMPAKAQEGEYNCILFRNGRNDVEYEFKTDLLSSIAHTDEGDVEFRYLRPEVFLMKYGEIKDKNKYYNGGDKKVFEYRKSK